MIGYMPLCQPFGMLKLCLAQSHVVAAMQVEIKSVFYIEFNQLYQKQINSCQHMDCFLTDLAYMESFLLS